MASRLANRVAKVSLILERPALPSSRTIAGGEGSLAAIAGAGVESLLYVENSNAVHAALEEVYDRRAREVHSATGVQLGNPVLDAYDDFRQAQAVWQAEIAAGTARAEGPPAFASYFEQRQKDWDSALALASDKNPDSQVRDRLMRSIEGEAINLARDSDEQLALLMESRAGVDKWIAMFAGGAVGSLADPITLMSLAAGGGPGSARTVVGRIATVAAKEAGINMATEAAVQPAVQRWRAELGLPAGFDEALANVLFAGAVGGVLGGAGRALGELASARGGRKVLAEQAAEQVEPRQARAPSRPMADPSESLPLRTAAPELRGATLEAARVVHADAARPAAAAAGMHDRSLATAERAIATRDADLWPGFEPDQAQVERVAAAIVGPVAGKSAEAAAPTNPLSRFLAGLGGVREQGGELAMIGVDRHTSTGAGKLLSRNGLTLDYAREAAAEAGFFDHLYGTPDEALARSTPRDLLDMLDAEQRARAASGHEAQLAGVESTLAEIARLAGPGLPDALLERAGRLAADGMDAGDALERVLTRDELGADAALRGGVGVENEPLPGWGDEDLWAAGENRAGRPEADGQSEPDQLAGGSATPAATVTDMGGTQSPIRGEALPTRGLAVAIRYENGIVYVGKPGEVHFQLGERYPHDERGDPDFIGFVNPEGQLLNRKEALEWTERQGAKVKPSGDMGRNLDALDYREQVIDRGQLGPEKPRPAVSSEEGPIAAELADADPAEEIPWFEGSARLSDVLDDVKHTRGMAALVEACKV